MGGFLRSPDDWIVLQNSAETFGHFLEDVARDTMGISKNLASFEDPSHPIKPSDLPICVVGAGVYALLPAASLQRRSQSSNWKFPSVDGPQMESVFQKARQKYLADLQLHLASSTSLEPLAASGQFRITAIDADPLTTANTANTLAIIARHRQAPSAGFGRRAAGHQFFKNPRCPEPPSFSQSA